MAGYQDLIDWCNKTQIPGNRRTAVSVNLYQAPAPGLPAEAAWVGTLTASPPAAPQTFELDGTLRPLEQKDGEVELRIVIDSSHQHASATITGHKIANPWGTGNPVLIFNEVPDYENGDAVISGKVELVPSPPSVGSVLYPIILGPTYTYHPPTTP